jgi:hypothetical protein
VRTSFAEFQRQQQELVDKVMEQRRQQIGPFNFKYNNDIEATEMDESEICTDL